MTRKKKCNSESNSFVVAKEEVSSAKYVFSVLEHWQQRGQCNIAWQAIPHLCSSNRKGTISDSWLTTGQNVKLFSGGGPEPALVRHVSDTCEWWHQVSGAEPCRARYVSLATLNIIRTSTRANEGWGARRWCDHNVSGWKWALLRHFGLTGEWRRWMWVLIGDHWLHSGRNNIMDNFFHFQFHTLSKHTTLVGTIRHNQISQMSKRCKVVRLSSHRCLPLTAN